MKAHITKINRELGEDVVKIGEGQYSKVYRSQIDSSKVYIVAPSDDCAKESVMMIQRYGDIPMHLPKMISKFNFTARGIDYNVYETEYSVAPTGEAQAIATQLNTLWCDYKRANNKLITKDLDNRADLVQTFIESLASHNIPETIIAALQVLYNWLRNYGENLWLEFPMRNLAQDDNGTLILRDVAFFVNLGENW